MAYFQIIIKQESDKAFRQGEEEVISLNSFRRNFLGHSYQDVPQDRWTMYTKIPGHMFSKGPMSKWNLKWKEHKVE